MTHPETKQLREDEAEYQRRLDKGEERARAIELEVAMMQVEIAAKGQHHQFVHDWVADPAAEYADIVRLATLYHTDPFAIGMKLVAIINNRIYDVAQTVVDRRLEG